MTKIEIKKYLKEASYLEERYKYICEKINIAFIKLPMNVIKNSIIGCNKLADVMFPSCNH